MNSWSACLGTSEGGVQLQELHRGWPPWMGACQEDKYWMYPVSTTSLRLSLMWEDRRLSLMWEDRLGWLAVWYCFFILHGGVGGLFAVWGLCRLWNTGKSKDFSYCFKFIWSL